MIKFVPVIADYDSKRLENQQYFSYILSLFWKYKDLLVDDYYPEDRYELLKAVMAEINGLYPWFLLCVINGVPIGVVWLTHWHGSGDKPHSCQVQAVIDRKFWGKISRFAIHEFFKYLFYTVGVERAQLEIPEHNKLACAFARKTGFNFEGIVRCATLKDEKPVNNLLFSLLKAEFKS